MRKLCIVHFHELEKFPPAINFVRYLSQHSNDTDAIDVLTTASASSTIADIGKAKIHTLVRWKKRLNKVERMGRYLQFNLRAFFKLIRLHPNAILYYETLSAGPCLLYKKFINPSVELFIHYHEYTSPQEYQTGMVLNRWLHNMELGWYKKSNWVSHTNKDRMKLFLKDVNSHAPEFTHLLPNYPPRNWKGGEAKERSQRIKFVYVGALSMDTMYVKEMVDFICTHKEKCCLDIYSSNISDEVVAYLKRNACDVVQFKGSLPYHELPAVLSTYNVGLVIYKGHIPNYIFNVPNKLFEYHVCGLDVWFPSSMVSAREFVTSNSFPKILPVDFNQLSSLDLEETVNRSNIPERRYEFYCEAAYEALAESLFGRHAK